jgi:hypothetical protein
MRAAVAAPVDRQHASAPREHRSSSQPGFPSSRQSLRCAENRIHLMLISVNRTLRHIGAELEQKVS